MRDAVVTLPPIWLQPFLTPKKLPKGWIQRSWTEDGGAWSGPGKISVVVSGDVKDDGKRWIHASIARKDYVPTYTDLQLLRSVWLGDDRYCVMVWPPKDRYVNIHPHCLHLFSCLDEWPLPEMSGFVPGIARRSL